MFKDVKYIWFLSEGCFHIYFLLSALFWDPCLVTKYVIYNTTYKKIFLFYVVLKLRIYIYSLFKKIYILYYQYSKFSICHERDHLLINLEF